MKQYITPLVAGAAALMSVASAQNDECATADVLTLAGAVYDTGTATLSLPAWGCASGGAPDLWYEFTAPNTATYEFETCGSSYDTALELFGGTCAALSFLQCNDDACGLQSRVRFDALAGDVVYLRVGGWNNSTGAGVITVNELVPRMLSLVAHYKLDDMGANLADSSGNGLGGSYFGGTQGVMGAAPGTNVCVDFDGLTEYAEIGGAPLLDDLRNDFSAAGWFFLDGSAMSGNGTSTIQRIFGNTGPGGSWSFAVSDNLNSVGGPGMRLTTHGVLDYDIAAPVMLNTWQHAAVVMDFDNDVTFYLNGVAVGTVPGTNPANSASPTYVVGAWWPTGTTVPEFFNGKLDDIQVYGGALDAAQVASLFANPGSVADPGSLGMRYCTPGVPNSSGNSGSISAMGNSVASANDVTLVASDLSMNSFGFFLTSQTQGMTANPGGSQGILCLGGAIGRYVGAGQIMNSGVMGEISLLLDLTQTPTPTGLVTVQAGQTWNFQLWHRDAVGGMGTSNFTDAVSVLFQ